jgi:hypothetical protein
MKRKIYLIVILFLSLSAMAQQQLPNTGFENWTNVVLFEEASDWTCSNSGNLTENQGIEKSVDAYSGEYSVQLKSVLSGLDTIFSFVYQGYLTNDGPGGGIPYSENFDGISGYYKCNMAEHDSATILVVKFLESEPTWFFAKIGGVANDWTEFYFDLPPTICDSVFVGFVSADIFTETVHSFDSWIMFDSINFTFSGGENPNPDLIPNYDFELWEDASVEEPDTWFTMNSYFYGLTEDGFVEKSIDAHSGNFAVQLSTKLLMGETVIPGYLSLGEITMDDENPVAPIPYMDTPEKITGYYKYAPVDEDVAILQVEFLNIVDPDNPVAGGVYYFTPAIDYTYFELEFTEYLNSPNALRLIFASGSIPGSVLTIDDIAFDFGVSFEINEINQLSIYPNPVSDILFVNFEIETDISLQITDVSGRLVKEQSCSSNTQIKIDCSDLLPGVYFVSDKSTGLKKQFVVTR